MPHYINLHFRLLFFTTQKQSMFEWLTHSCAIFNQLTSKYYSLNVSIIFWTLLAKTLMPKKFQICQKFGDTGVIVCIVCQCYSSVTKPSADLLNLNKVLKRAEDGRFWGSHSKYIRRVEYVLWIRHLLHQQQPSIKKLASTVYITASSTNELLYLLLFRQPICLSRTDNELKFIHYTNLFNKQ